MFLNKHLATSLGGIYRKSNHISSFPMRMFASLTLDRTPGKILYGGAEAYYKSKVAAGDLREDENQLELA